MAAPTLSSYQQSVWTDRVSTNEVTASVTWSTSDLIVVIGLTEDAAATLALPTATGLTFSQIVAVGPTSSCHAYLWTATSSGSSSGAITSVVDATARMRGLSAFVYSSHGGLGNTSISSVGETGSVRSLVRAGDNSAMVFGLADWTANADVTVTNVPSTSGTQRVATTQGGIATMFVLNWGDQGAAGTANVGIAGFAGVTNNIMVAAEIKGIAGGDTLLAQSCF